ncbi:MFS general substrate transporter [Stipitochalara longipes BDJ]|nr:MFS general substrate transporter [Stipitochalara longipes BDJ]
MESHDNLALNDLSNYLGHDAPRDLDIVDDLSVQTGQHEFSLPPADGGKAAWLFLAAGFVVEALVWGFPFSFGIFQEYYTAHEPFSSEPSGITVIGTTSTGIMYMSGLILFPAYKKWPRLAQTSQWAGMPLMAAGLTAASFANKGVLYGIGVSIIYCPTLLFIDEWFIQRKGLAYGVLWAGTSTAGVIVPLLLNVFLGKYGFRTTLRIWATTILILSTPLIYFLRPRLPVSLVSQSPRYSLGFLKSTSFWLLQICLIIESLGYFLPSIYLPTLAKSLRFSPGIGSMLIALLNGSAVFATIIMGMLCDRFHVTTVILLSAVGATFSVFVFWGSSTTLPLLFIFAILYGFFAGGFVSTNAGVIKLVKRQDQGTDIGMLLGIIRAGRGTGSLLSGPLSVLLLRGRNWDENTGGAGYGSKYENLVVFTGVTAAVGGLSFLGKRLGWIQ